MNYQQIVESLAFLIQTYNEEFIALLVVCVLISVKFICDYIQSKRDDTDSVTPEITFKEIDEIKTHEEMLILIDMLNQRLGGCYKTNLTEEEFNRLSIEKLREEVKDSLKCLI